MIIINNQSFSFEQLKEIFESSFTKLEVAIKLGFSFTNGKVYKKIVALAEKYNLSINHFDPNLKNKVRRIHQQVVKKCPVCKKEFKTVSSGPQERITCGHSCSNKHFSHQKYNDKVNKKRSDSMNDFHRKSGTTRLSRLDNCLYCNNQFTTMSKKKKFCNNSCAKKYLWTKPGYRNNIISKINERIVNGTHKGWATRTKLEPSYAEKYVIKLLEELSITYTREYKVNKWFIDFADIDRKLALEIDGKQHTLPERKASDQAKDHYLKDNGWTVLRIKWKKITKEFREEIIENINVLFNINKESTNESK